MEVFSGKRFIDQLASSDSESEPPPRKMLKRQLQSPRRRSTLYNSKQSRKTQEFAKFLSKAFPSRLLNVETRDYFIWRSNLRIQEAVEKGLQANDIFIAIDCLPSWRGMIRDTHSQTMHEAIQMQLLHSEHSERLGPDMQADLMKKGNRKLNEAVAMGIPLERIFFGEGMLPDWEKPMTFEEDSGDEGDVEDEEDDHNEPQLLSYDIEQSEPEGSGQSDWSTYQTPTEGFLVPDPNIIESIEPRDPYIPSQNWVDPRSQVPPSDSNTESESDAECSCDESGDDHDDQFVYTITLQNLVNPLPSYSDEDVATVFHDVEVVGGGARGFQEVDFEAFVVDGNDSEVQEVPEAELAVDREAWEAHNMDSDDAVDVEVPGMDFRFTTEWEIEELTPEEELAYFSQEHLPAPMFHAIPTIQEPEGDVDANDDASEEVTTYDDEGDSSNTMSEGSESS